MLWCIVLLSLFSLPTFSENKSSEPKHIQIARQYDGWTETYENRGSVADSCNLFVGAPLGSPFCQTFWEWILNKANAKPKWKRTALAQNVKTKDSYSAMAVIQGHRKVKCGDMITYAKGKTIFGHSGCASSNWKNTSGKSIEANTKKKGMSRVGDGIYEKTVRIEPYNYFRIIRFTPVDY